MKKVKGLNDPACRELAKSYLACRMDKYAFFLVILVTSGVESGVRKVLIRIVI